MNFQICFQHLVLLEMIGFEKIFNLHLVAKKMQNDANNLGSKFFLLATQISGGFLL